MIVAGGSYVERCKYPSWERLFGSGIRSALALQKLSPSCVLHTYAPSTYRQDVEATLGGAVVIFDPHEDVKRREMVFEWLHPFELVSWPDPPEKPYPSISIESDAVLRFGMIEGSAKVKASRAVYDPQNEAGGFFANGSKADELAIVLSTRDLRHITGEDDVEKGMGALFELQATQRRFLAVLLKDRFGGFQVFLDSDDPQYVPTYAAESFFKIGAGDVLAAAFAHAWAECRLDVMTSADIAAKALAWFVEDGRLPLPTTEGLPIERCSVVPDRVRLLGADTLEVGQLLISADDWVRDLGVRTELEIFNDIKSTPVPTLVLVGEVNDTEELRRLAAASAGASRIIVYWPNDRWNNAAHLFPDARVTQDFSSALFHLLRSSSGATTSGI